MVARTSLLTNLYNKGFDNSADSDAKKAREIEEIRKYFEQIFASRAFSFSIYELREIFDRYVGLSLEVQAEEREIAPAETEIFRVSNHSNKKLAAICLNRRNRKRLSFHQKIARRDFFETLSKFIDQIEGRQIFFEQAAKLAVLVNDPEAQTSIAEFAKESAQTEAREIVRNTGKEQWMPDQHKLPTDSKISTNLQALTATANLSNKD